MAFEIDIDQIRPYASLVTCVLFFLTLNSTRLPTALLSFHPLFLISIFFETKVRPSISVPYSVRNGL